MQINQPKGAEPKTRDRELIINRQGIKQALVYLVYMPSLVHAKTNVSHSFGYQRFLTNSNSEHSLAGEKKLEVQSETGIFTNKEQLTPVLDGRSFPS